MANFTLSPSPLANFYDTDGITPLANGRVFTYAAGTTNPSTTYQTATGPANLNPIQLNAAGFANIFLAPGSYLYVWYRAPTIPGNDTSGGLVNSQDNIQATTNNSENTDMQELAGEPLTANQCVYLSDGSGGKNAGQLYKADIANGYSSLTPLLGIVPDAIAQGSLGTFRIQGQLTGLALINGADYYVGSAGALTTSASGPNTRWVGRADSTSSIIISPNPPTALGSLDILQIEALT